MLRTPTLILLGAEAPRVLTIPMLAAVLADRRKLPARNTLFRWAREQVAGGVLRPVTRGFYLNQLAAPKPAAAEAAGFVRTGAIVSLQTVLGEAGIANNFPDVVTSVLPHERGHVSSVRPVKAADVEFRFHSMPSRLLDDRAGKLEDRLDLDVKHPRATPEKALLDWLYLGASRYSKIAGPPLDLELEQLVASRLRRLARTVGVTKELAGGRERGTTMPIRTSGTTPRAIWRCDEAACPGTAERMRRLGHPALVGQSNELKAKEQGH